MVDPGASERQGSAQPKLERAPPTPPRREPKSSAKTCTSGVPTTSASAQALLQAPSGHASQTLPLPIVAESATSLAIDRIPDHYAYETIDRAFKANLARLTFGLSPAVLGEQFVDWLAHIAISPGKQLQLSEKWFRTCARFNLYAAQSAVRSESTPCAAPLPNDWRFRAKEWQQWPYNLIYQSFLLTEEWWLAATRHVDGMSQHNERSLSFTVRQVLDMMSPSNFIWANPEVARATLEQGGRNLGEGFKNLIEDWQRAITGKPPVGAENFVVGQNIAVTPGKVVFQNRLIELIQYSPATDQVYAEPVLIVPAWIMKYYILDLSPQNSLVKYLVDQGHTVFMISWKNPTQEDRDLGMNEYRRLGVMAALGAIAAIVPERKVHAAGYCLGGTMLLIAAAAMARDHDDRLASTTLFAAQADFTEAGELTLFVNESEISYLENMMWDHGYLDTYQMAGAFQILRSNDLIWSRYVREYLLGGRQAMSDLMAWNADLTRMPYRMHSEYLRRLFLKNDLAEGRFEVEGRPISVSDIRLPNFVVSTVTDHVAPWRSVYKFHLVPNELTFVLTSGGHNAGIVSEPGHPRRSYQIRARRADERYLDPDMWQAETPVRQGSWWPEWESWLAQHSTRKVEPPSMGAPEKGYAVRRDAPGFYVRQP